MHISNMVSKPEEHLLEDLVVVELTLLGKFVRLAPNLVTVNDPAAIKGECVRVESEPFLSVYYKPMPTDDYHRNLWSQPERQKVHLLPTGHRTFGDRKHIQCSRS